MVRLTGSVAVPERDDEMSGGRADLEAALHGLGGHVDVPPQPNYAHLVQQRLDDEPIAASTRDGRQRRLPTSSPLAAGAIVLLVVLAVVFTVPTSRHAVADLFGFAGVEVHPLPSAGPSPRTSLDPSVDLGEPVTLAKARASLSFTIAVPTAAGLGEPDTVYLRRGPGLESVALVYGPRDGFPAGVDSHVGLVLSEYAGTATPYFDKYVDEQQPPMQVTVAGRWAGLYLAGPQEVLVRDATGVVHDEHPRLSAPTLVWVRGAVTYRLEANVSKGRALALATSLP
jgi:hypothetical protein